MLDPHWREWHKLWSMRLAILWMILSGAWIALPAFSSMLPPVPFALVCMGFSVAIGLARITNQPGVNL